MTDEVDYMETHDVAQVHAAIRREKSDPGEGTTEAPIWLLSLCGAALMCAGFYLGMYNGGFDPTVFDWYTRPLPGASGSQPGPGGAAPTELTPVQLGQNVFKLNCATCHQDTGLGVPGQYPPLAKSEYVNGSPKRLGMILLKGIQGNITVEGHQFGAAVMPAWDKLSDQKIADVLTYVRQEWGNTSGEITPEQIASARKQFAGQAESWDRGRPLESPKRRHPSRRPRAGGRTRPGRRRARSLRRPARSQINENPRAPSHGL